MLLFFLVVLSVYMYTPIRINSFFYFRSPFRAVDFHLEIEKAQQAIRMWHRYHPMGAINEDDRLELDKLVHQEAGLRLACYIENDRDYHVDEILINMDPGEDWRN